MNHSSRINYNKIFKLSENLRTPFAVQKFIQDIPYNSLPTLRSAAKALELNTLHCIEAAFLAAAILEFQDFEPLILDLESRDNLDHVVFVFKEKGYWGAISRSKELGLQGREPVFKSIEKLAESYYEPYVDNSGCITAFQVFHLDELPGNWRNDSRNLWRIEKYMIEQPHYRMRKSHQEYIKIKKRYLKLGPPTEHPSWW